MITRGVFIAGLASVAGWPLMVRAQQSKVWRVGYLSPSSATKINAALFDTFRAKLEELGYVEGKNLNLDVVRADDDYTRLPSLAVTLVSLAPDVIVGNTPPAIAALQHATSSIPIIMASTSDPVAFGFVKSLAKPGGNITGLSNLAIDLSAKSLELLHTAVPRASRIAVLTSKNPTHELMLNEAHVAAERLGLKIIPMMARTPAELNETFAAMYGEHCDALFVLADVIRTNQKAVELADQWRLPAIYQISGLVEMGGLLSYGQNYTEMYQQAAIYVDKILRGANPADLPVEQPTRLELQVNLKTAKTLGLTIPDSVIARADKVIE